MAETITVVSLISVVTVQPSASLLLSVIKRCFNIVFGIGDVI